VARDSSVATGNGAFSVAAGVGATIDATWRRFAPLAAVDRVAEGPGGNRRRRRCWFPVRLGGGGLGGGKPVAPATCRIDRRA
jgi:hypothetical protein